LNGIARSPGQGSVAAAGGPHVVRVTVLRAADVGFWGLQPLAQQFLTARERVEFGRIRSAAVRGRRVACRGWLRMLLGESLGMAPTAVALSRSVHGRPELLHGPRGVFNVSQSDGVVVVAVLRPPWPRGGLRIGVDIETPVRRWTPDLAAALYSEAELGWLAARPAAQRDAGFLLLWTLREAVLKADGRGLSMDLRQIRLQPPDALRWEASGDGGRVTLQASPLIDPQRWCCWVRQQDGAVCALAVHGGEGAPLEVELECIDEAAAIARMRCALAAALPVANVGYRTEQARPQA
jgi:4'-phosphopantetheinyl transferase